MSNRPDDNSIEFIDPSELIGFSEDEGDEIYGQSQIPLPASESPAPEEFEDQESEEATETTEEVEYYTPLTDSIREFTHDYVTKKREDTRGSLALIYTIATFGIFVLTFFVAVLDGILRQVSIVDNLSKLIPLISGVFLGSLGFVLGYYFRQKEEPPRDI